jgi:FKBP-type peptidyl-prolyl cis-trans isomerase
MTVSILARVLRIALLPVFALSIALSGGALAATADVDYLNANKAKPGVQVTKTGLQYRVLREGNGNSPGPTDEVEVHYKGTLVNGQQFDSSYDRGSPARFPLNRVIPGWTEGLQLMKEGAKYEFVIPASLGYGTMGAGNSIPPNATLIFEVELFKVR